jgi:hypothetical protein
MLILWCYPEEFGWYDGGLKVLRFGFDFRAKQDIFLYSAASRPTLGSTQFPVQWIREVLYSVKKWPGRKAPSTPIPPTVEVNNGGTLPRLSHTYSWCSNIKSKVESVLNLISATPWRRVGEWMYRSTFSWPRYYLEVQLYAMVALTAGIQYASDRKLGGPQIRTGRSGERKTLDSTRTRSPFPRSSSQ